ncbi:glucan biosynthesis protein [Sulfitobacter donghicola]|uniref:Glucan biosynthesis protein G n=1 Tax=Sulfitobacter donghicola DSW-25 = KCTC 12864 = JCM 14565 TaxID=1300350 RepID=A0A073IJS5_9RHOB|nr:glucan biosynthesis protein G [Sulfitobacter donghicola]KEJ89786.1 glucan biosynthesis protein G [Sulfitobacter donghicola DSW-25 = KCTC 12864 = JCM 14565]KIN67108.1 Glucans biosynthesis protein G [Sulfitobacter donghicola DSW-25 = KCTC 12864 = JCM 14565]
MFRRDVLKALAALAATPTAALAGNSSLQTGGSTTPFNDQTVRNLARALADKDYMPRPTIPQEWQDISYDQYRRIWFDTDNALWEGTDVPLRLDVFSPGLYFPQAVDVSIVEDGGATPLLFDFDVFHKSATFPELPQSDHLGYSGIRLRADLRGTGRHTEYAVFQGASYFRGIGTGETYGLSARGLALKTADPMGEEFPDFVAFWLETPNTADKSVTLYALMDSPSCTGAYRFEIAHGDIMNMEVEATIFARTDLAHVGIAPLTSMFMFDGTDRARFSDFRPNVHDSDGLLIHNGAGEVIWRPLANPKTLQVSAFGDHNPKGFGLMQRKREFGDFNDLEALYHNRPSAWITPRGDWGAGAVTLVEIPTDLEIYDNIVSYWRPAQPIVAGSETTLRYGLQWGADPSPDMPPLLPVVKTAMGERPEGGILMVIDFDNGPAMPDDLDEIEITLRSNHGSTTKGVLQRNPETNGPRLAFTFDPQGSEVAEFRVQLRKADAPLSEVWLYRWTKTA